MARTVNGNEVTYSFEIPSTPTICLYDGSDLEDVGGSGKWFDVTESNGIHDPNFMIYPLGEGIKPGSSPHYVVDVSDLCGEALVSFSTSFVLRFIFGYNQTASGSSDIYYNGYYHINCYRADGSYITTVNSGPHEGSLTVREAPYDSAAASPGLYPFTVLSTIPVPADCAYIVPAIYFSFENFVQGASSYVSSCQPVYNKMTIKIKENAILKQSELIEGISSQIENVEIQLGDLNDKADQIIQQPDQEKQEASSSGSDAVDQLTEVIPDKTGGLWSFARQLSSAMSYEGTDAKLTFPAITLPAIPGVMDSYQLSEEQEIDFGYWVEKMPSSLLTLVQVLLTIGLYIYALKELYSLIEYALTLRGGKSDV